MSENTRKEVLATMRRRDATAGPEHKGKLIDEVVELFGYHRKAAIRALRRSPPSAGERRVRERSAQRVLPGATAQATEGDLAGGLATLWQAAVVLEKL